MKIQFHLRFATRLGESIQMKINNNGNLVNYPLVCIDSYHWAVEIESDSTNLEYHFELINERGDILQKEFTKHQIEIPKNFSRITIIDEWNKPNYPENYLNNKIFQNTNINFKNEKKSVLKKHNYIFRIVVPLYHKNWRLVLLGNSPKLGSWDYEKAIAMKQTHLGIWEVAITLEKNQNIEYKYGILDENTGKIIDLENGNNRTLFSKVEKDSITIKSDYFFKYHAYQMYHAAGVAVPVFSLRSENGFGVGEFSDIPLLADWANETNLKIIQILPINDTTANYTWTDSYPYAAISVYALHPQYISLEKLPFGIPKKFQTFYKKEKKLLNALENIDYEKVIDGKWKILKQIFEDNFSEIEKDKNFKKFITENENWLYTYSAFCVLRDQYKTPNFGNWKTHQKYNSGKIKLFFQPKNKNYKNALLHSWVQYMLHLQLKEAVDYCHQKGVSIKGDLPIGIYRYSVEAWVEPQLFGMDFQAGAPPDQFTDLGQNWEFPTYNWEAMKKDGYKWWKNRFKALEQYFDAMRIDHILGFFRIWRIPISATQGILGYFYPSIPITKEEFQSRNIYFDYQRFCKPFINDAILWDFFGEQKDEIQNLFLENHFNGLYSFKPELDTQRKLKEYFEQNPHWAEDKLISLCANVLFLEEERNGEMVYHPRFNVQKTSSFQNLSYEDKHKIETLSIDYFFKRQEGLWYQSAMEKLPEILNASQMLICGEDLGLVPNCVPDVMDQLAIIALKVQRMPSENIPFYNPKNASYLNVVTVSSHDSSTLRQWWQENRILTEKYFREQLLQFGSAPNELVPELAEIILKQHLYNDAMLAIFPIQEFLATDYNLRNKNMEIERINNPAVFPHYWRYRMHLNLEELLKQKDFNNKISNWIKDSNRC